MLLVFCGLWQFLFQGNIFVVQLLAFFCLHTKVFSVHLQLVAKNLYLSLICLFVEKKNEYYKLWPKHKNTNKLRIQPKMKKWCSERLFWTWIWYYLQKKSFQGKTSFHVNWPFSVVYLLIIYLHTPQYLKVKDLLSTNAIILKNNCYK